MRRPRITALAVAGCLAAACSGPRGGRRRRHGGDAPHGHGRRHRHRDERAGPGRVLVRRLDDRELRPGRARAERSPDDPGVFAALKAQGIAPADIRTDQISLTPNTNEAGNDGRQLHGDEFRLRDDEEHRQGRRDHRRGRQGGREPGRGPVTTPSDRAPARAAGAQGCDGRCAGTRSGDRDRGPRTVGARPHGLGVGQRAGDREPGSGEERRRDPGRAGNRRRRRRWTSPSPSTSCSARRGGASGSTARR